MDRRLRMTLLVSLVIHAVLLLLSPRWTGAFDFLRSPRTTPTVRRVVIVSIEGNEQRFVDSSIAIAVGRGEAFGGPPALTRVTPRPEPRIQPQTLPPPASLTGDGQATRPLGTPSETISPRDQEPPWADEPVTAGRDPAVPPAPVNPPADIRPSEGLPQPLVAEEAPRPSPVSREGAPAPRHEVRRASDSPMPAPDSALALPAAALPPSVSATLAPEVPPAVPSLRGPAATPVPTPAPSDVPAPGSPPPISPPLSAALPSPASRSVPVAIPVTSPVVPPPVAPPHVPPPSAAGPAAVAPLPATSSMPSRSWDGPYGRNDADVAPRRGDSERMVAAVTVPSPAPTPPPVTTPALLAGDEQRGPHVLPAERSTPAPGSAAGPTPEPSPGLPVARPGAQVPTSPERGPRPGEPLGEGVPLPTGAATVPTGTGLAPGGQLYVPSGAIERGGAVADPLPAPPRQSGSGWDVTPVPDDKARLAPSPLTPIYAPYPESLAGSGIEIVVYVRLWLDGDGKVIRWEAPNFRGEPAFIESIAGAVDTWRFRVHPAWSLAGRQPPAIVVPVHFSEAVDSLGND